MIEFIIIPLLCFWWVHQLPFIARFKWKRKKKSMKPFDCELCLAFWLTLAFCIVNREIWYICIMKAGISSSIANLIYLIARRCQMI